MSRGVVDARRKLCDSCRSDIWNILLEESRRQKAESVDRVSPLSPNGFSTKIYCASLIIIELSWYPIMMRKDKSEAFRLRKSGKSYGQIIHELKIPKGTLSGWFANIDWSDKLKQRLSQTVQMESTKRMVALNAVRGKHLKRAYAEARCEARAELAVLKYNPMFIAGLMLYWGEGDKRTRSQVRLCNTDPELVRLFVLFLEKACQIPREHIKASVLIYPDLSPEECLSFWSKRSTVRMSNFHKCVTILGRHKTRKLSHGVCSVMVISTYFKEKMLEWLKHMSHELMSKKYYATIERMRV